MVKIQVIRNEEKKKYECIVTFENDPYSWEITTPRKFTIIRSNYPVFDKETDVHVSTDFGNGSTKERWLHFYADRSKDRMGYFYPITQKWRFRYMPPTEWPLSEYVETAAAFLKQEIIHYALEHDRKEMMLVHLEHLSTKSMFVSDMKEIGCASNKT